MITKIAVLALTLALSPLFVRAQEKPAQQNPAKEKPVLVVDLFTVNSGVAWPYNMKQLQMETVAGLIGKSSQHVDAVAEPPEGRKHVFTLDGEIEYYHRGNIVVRWLVGLGEGREEANIHYWVSDENGKRVFEHRDQLRAEFWGNQYKGSMGQLAHPFADKIAKRLTEAKVF